MPRIICTHPETKLVSTTNFIRTLVLKPECTVCHGKNLRFESDERETNRGSNQEYNADTYGVGYLTREYYRCSDCGQIYSPNEYREMSNDLKLLCPKCNVEVIEQQEVPHHYECPKCCQVYMKPDDVEQLRHATYSYRPEWVKCPKYSDEENEDNDVYDCPIYGTILRPRGDYRCKCYCGYRETGEPPTLQKIPSRLKFRKPWG